MLGAASEAQDVAQEAWLRWQRVDEATVENPRAWLNAAVSRLCLDRLKSAQHRHESYPGPWLPEPVATETPIDRESISLAFLVLLERLTPVERAVLLMHRVFEYRHAEIATALEMNEVAVRQAYHRASQHLATNRPRFAPSTAEHARILRAFAWAVANGDLPALLHLLAADARLYADSGGKVRGAALRPLVGAERVAAFLVGAVGGALGTSSFAFTVESINGWPALVARDAGRTFAVVTIETDGQKVVAVRNLLNPEKLALPMVT